MDFVLKEGLEFEQLIQVTYAVDRDEMERGEVEALLKASDEFNCKRLDYTGIMRTN